MALTDNPDRGDEINQPTDADKAAADKAAADKAAAEKAEADKVAELANKDEKDDKGEKDEKDDKGEKRGKIIPLDRHEAILRREREAREAAEAQLAKYAKGEAVSEINKDLAEAEQALLDMETKYDKLLVDGKTDEAARVRAEIRALDRKIADKKVEFATAAAESRAYEKARYDTTVDRIEAAYPVLNPDSETYDADLARRVTRVAHSYQLDGFTPSKAVQEAVKTLLGEPATMKQQNAVEVEARVSDAEAARAKREEEARKKALDTKDKQPASLAKVGADSDKLGQSSTKLDVMKMSQEDFANLATKDPEALAKLRGDEI